MCSVWKLYGYFWNTLYFEELHCRFKNEDPKVSFGVTINNDCWFLAFLLTLVTPAEAPKSSPTKSTYTCETRRINESGTMIQKRCFCADSNSQVRVPKSPLSDHSTECIHVMRRKNWLQSCSVRHERGLLWRLQKSERRHFSTFKRASIKDFIRDLFLWWGSDYKAIRKSSAMAIALSK
jgi:hypothetical protein